MTRNVRILLMYVALRLLCTDTDGQISVCVLPKVSGKQKAKKMLSAPFSVQCIKVVFVSTIATERQEILHLSGKLEIRYRVHKSPPPPRFLS